MIAKKDLLITGAFIFLILGCFYLKPACALDVNGLISSDSRWTSADSPVNITDDVRVDANTTLRIDPGVEVIFQSPPDVSQGYSLKIDGALIARGNQKQPITFTAEDPSVPWGAIIFSDQSRDWDQEASAGSIMEYCVVEYGGNEPDGNGMITTINAMPLIARNAIRFSNAAGISALVSGDPAVIESLSGSIRIISNRIYSNALGIRFSAEGGVIENNYFLNNNRAIALQVRSNSLEIINNTVISSAPQLFGTGIQLILDEAASGITAYQWRQTAGPNVTLSNPQSARTAFTAPDPGNKIETLAFELTVTGQDGDKTTNTVKVNVIGDNPPPVANAGRDRNVQLPQAPGEEVTITLSAEGSSDPYLGITDYKWKQTDGPSVQLAGANTISPTFNVPSSVSAGDRMTFQVTVTDQAGLSSSDEVKIIFFDDNVFPSAQAGENRRVLQGSKVTLDGTGSADADGSITAYEWTQISGPPVELVKPNTARPYFEAPADNNSAETLTFQLQATDNGGLKDTDEVSITVLGPLVADITTRITEDNQVTLDGSDSFYQDATARIDIYANALKMDNADAGLLALSAVEDAAFELDLTRNNLSAAENEGYIVYTYDWAAEAPDTISLPDNWWGTEDAQIIEGLIYDQVNNYELPELKFQPFAKQPVKGAGSSLSYPPLANAGPDLKVAADNVATLDGTNSYDPEGIARYHWEQIEGPAVNLQNAEQATANFIAPSGGEEDTTLEFELTVSTDAVFSHKDRATVTVSPDEEMPTVDVDSCFIASSAPGRAGNYLHAKLLTGGVFFLLILLSVVSGRFRSACRFCALIVLFLLISVPAQAGYLSVGVGDGGDADEVNVTLETGAKDIRFKGRDLLFGMGIHFIPHSDDELPDPTISAPCPNEACTRLGTVRKGTEVGLFGKLGVEIAKSDFYVSAIGGFTAFTESELSRSPATGRVYEDSSDSQIEGLYGGGVSYFFDFKWDILLQVDYDNIRGVTGGIGLHW